MSEPGVIGRYIVEREIGRDYPWPGNMRELEQGVRNILVRREYHPTRPVAVAESPSAPLSSFAEEILQGSLSADQVLSRYCTLIYAQEDSYEAAARRLQLDRRTVKSRVDRDFLETLSSTGGDTS